MLVLRLRLTLREDLVNRGLLVLVDPSLKRGKRSWPIQMVHTCFALEMHDGGNQTQQSS